MKYFCFLLISSVLCLSACKKNNEEVVVNDGLIGKWQLVRRAEGIGNMSFSYYYPDAKKLQIIEFKKDSSFTANINSIYLKGYNLYSIINSRDMIFSPNAPANPSDKWGYKTSNGTMLTLYMFCGEGCFFEYKAIR